MVKKFSVKLGEKELVIETGRFAKQAHGAVAVQLGGTVVLTTAVCSKDARPDADFFPLMVDYRERTYAAGKIPGGFFKREGRPNEKEVLSSRLVDRPIRPLFPEGMTHEVQIMSTVLSSDAENDSDILALIGAATALTISDIPFNGPIGGVRVGNIGGRFVANPTFKELDESSIDIVVAGDGEKVCMLEAGMKEVSEEEALKSIEFAQPFLKTLVELQKRMASEIGLEKRKLEYVEVDEEIKKKVAGLMTGRIREAINIKSRDERQEEFELIKKEAVEKLVTEETKDDEKKVKFALHELEKELVRSSMLNSDSRIDGRGKDDIRPIECEVAVLPRVHGSGLFTRGQTQSLSATTLGTNEDEQRIETLEGESKKKFMLHYNFPPFSVGEVKPIRGVGRREIGHGALAEKALKPFIPSKDDFPYTIRLVSDILESNGSSSMATVCAGTLALMDAGVPMKKHVAGIAIGLVKEGEKYVMLTDIAGLEDHFGDMDFKVAGTGDGITAIQMDLKIDGIAMPMIKEALTKAKTARMAVIEKLKGAIAAHRPDTSSYAPRITTLKVEQDKIKDIIGPGGKIIKKIVQDTGATINVEDDGTVQVASVDAASMQAAVDIINKITESPKVGKIYDGKVTKIMDFGAFCEILPGKEGLCHVSELADHYVKDVKKEVKVGDPITVKLVEIDSQGRLNLSKKQAMKEAEGEDKGKDKAGSSS